MKNFFDFSRQCKYLKLEKPLGIEIEMPIHKRLAINKLEGMAKKTPPGLIGISVIHEKLPEYSRQNLIYLLQAIVGQMYSNIKCCM